MNFFKKLFSWAQPNNDLPKPEFPPTKPSLLSKGNPFGTKKNNNNLKNYKLTDSKEKKEKFIGEGRKLNRLSYNSSKPSPSILKYPQSNSPSNQPKNNTPNNENKHVKFVFGRNSLGFKQEKKKDEENKATQSNKPAFPLQKANKPPDKIMEYYQTQLNIQNSLIKKFVKEQKLLSPPLPPPKPKSKPFFVDERIPKIFRDFLNEHQDNIIEIIKFKGPLVELEIYDKEEYENIQQLPTETFYVYDINKNIVELTFETDSIHVGQDTYYLYNEIFDFYFIPIEGYNDRFVLFTLKNLYGIFVFLFLQKKFITVISDFIKKKAELTNKYHVHIVTDGLVDANPRYQMLSIKEKQKGPHYIQFYKLEKAGEDNNDETVGSAVTEQLINNSDSCGNEHE